MLEFKKKLKWNLQMLVCGFEAMIGIGTATSSDIAHSVIPLETAIRLVSIRLLHPHYFFIQIPNFLASLSLKAIHGIEHILDWLFKP
jgi:hypothetical protein